MHIQPYTSNLQSLRSPITKMHKAMHNVEMVESGLTCLGVAQGHRQHSTERIRLPIQI